MTEIRTSTLIAENQADAAIADAEFPVGQKTASATWYVSPFLFAVLLFLLLNAALSYTNPITFDRFQFPYRNWIWWEINDLRKSHSQHNIAMLGSSLIISAIDNCDANYLDKKLDLSIYHGAAYLDHLLSVKFGGNFNTFDLATPGQSPVDAYLCLKSMMRYGNRPSVAIYGIAPRDFIDSTLSNINDTEAFRYLTRVVEFPDADAQVAYLWPLEKLAYYLQQTLYLSANTVDLQMFCANAEAWVMDKMAPQPASGAFFTWWDRVKFFPLYKPGELYPGSMVMEPKKPGQVRKFLDNTHDYEVRYRSPRKRAYDVQVYFLKKLIQFCKQQHIELVIINMPITHYNACMLRPGRYAAYVDAMRNIALTEHCTFYDLCNFTHYPITFYNDYVHLNEDGGKYFVEDLVNHLQSSNTVSATFKHAGGE